MALKRATYYQPAPMPPLVPTDRLGEKQARDAVLGGGLQLLSGAERLLWEASERALRQPKDKVALVLHLSRLAPPAPRPHHIRVANVLLQDSAQRYGGQVFSLRNRDLVLLGPSAGPAHANQTLAPENLPQTLARLFAADVPDASGLTSVWNLERDSAALLAYLSARAAAPPERETLADDLPASALNLAALQEILLHAPLADLMVQQTAMALGKERRVSPDRPAGAGKRLLPAYRELSVSLTSLNLQPVIARAISDPYLYRHFAAGLDTRLIQVLHDDLAGQGRLTRPALANSLPIHIDLGLEAILSPGFARLSRLARELGMRLGVAVPLMQVCAEYDLMEHARDVLRLTGCLLILNRVDPLSLSIVNPERVEPDLIKLAWSPLLAEAGVPGAAARNDGPGSKIARALARVSPAKLVLQGTDSEQALAWGQHHGITMFQGPYLDQVQAATRMARCHSASACTLRQCFSRAASLGIAGRAGCANPGLLESGMAAA